MTPPTHEQRLQGNDLCEYVVVAIDFGQRTRNLAGGVMTPPYG